MAVKPTQLMPVSVSIDKEKRLAICTAYGVVVNEDGPEIQRQLMAHPDFDPSFSKLLDMTAVTKLEIDAELIRKLAQSTVFHSSSRRAFVAGSDLTYGFSRMFEILLDSRGAGGITVFRTREEALLWLEQ